MGSFRGGTRDRLSLVEPDGVVERLRSVEVEGRKIRFFFVDQVPAFVTLGLVYRILEQDADMDVSVHIVPAETARVIRALNDQITTLQAQLILDQKRGNIGRLHETQAALQEKVALRDALQIEQDRLFQVTLVFSVAAETDEELDRKTRTLVDVLTGLGLVARVATARQMLALKTLLPFGRNELFDEYRNMRVDSASVLFPFFSDEMSHPEGIFWGFTPSGSPVFLNLFLGQPHLANPHMGLFATSGAGKTTALRTWIARSAVHGVRQVVLDPEGDYVPLREFADLEYVRVAPDAKGLLNPFDLTPDLRDPDDPDSLFVDLRQKQLDIRSLVMAMADWNEVQLGVRERNLLDETVLGLYAERGVTADPSSLYEEGSAYQTGEGLVLGRKPKAMPTLSDLYARLKEDEVLGPLLRQYTREGPLGLFDGPTQVDLSKPVLIFDLSRLDERLLRPLAMHVILEWVWERFVKGTPGAKQVIVDEAWMMMQKPDTASFMAEMAIRARKRNCALVVATQRFRHFAGEEGQSVLANLDTVMLMRQHSTEVDMVVEAFKLSAGQKAVLMDLKPGGDALLRAGSSGTQRGNMVRFQVHVFPFEEALKGKLH